jgi:chromosome segregation ATPase
VQDELVKELEIVERMEDDNNRLLKENSNLSKLNQEILSNQAGGEGKVSSLMTKLHALQLCLDSSIHEHNVLKGDLLLAISEKEQFEEKYKELEELLETYYSYRDTCQIQSDDIIQLTGQLEFLRDSHSRLKTRLSILEPVDSETDHGSKTILSEVEDRRRELENANNTLSEKHAGLVKGFF